MSPRKSAQRIEPAPGQESVWDYPRPPAIDACLYPVRVVLDGVDIARSNTALRVLETSHPPTYYIPLNDVRSDLLRKTPQASHCEWKGRACYFSVVVGSRGVENAAWSFPDPVPRFAPIRDCIAFYPQLMDACFVGEEQVQAQAGGFYGGWVTSAIVGPFKGAPGTWGW